MVVVLALMMSCRTTEKITISKPKPLSSVRLYKKAEENTFDFHHFNIKRINILYEKGENKTSFRAGLQAVKDSSILLSVSKLNILLARVMLTPDSIFYVNYFDKSYYAGGYEPVCDFLNFNLDFNTVQAIVSANVFMLFDSQKELREFKTWVEDNMYVLQSEAVRKLIRMEDKGKIQRIQRFVKRMGDEVDVVQTFYFDPELFTVQKVIMEDQTDHQQARLLFSDYEQVGQKYFPSTVEMSFHSEENTLLINAKMSGFSTLSGEFIPLRIPDKYRRIFLN